MGGSHCPLYLAGIAGPIAHRGASAATRPARIPLYRVVLSGPGVVSPDLPIAFARDAAYGDIVAAILALLALTALRSRLGIALVWVFNIWGTFDLLNAFYVANGAGLLAGQLGAAYFIPTAIVPLLLITHGLVFRVLLQHD